MKVPKDGWGVRVRWLVSGATLGQVGPDMFPHLLHHDMTFVILYLNVSIGLSAE